MSSRSLNRRRRRTRPPPTRTPHTTDRTEWAVPHAPAAPAVLSGPAPSDALRLAVWWSRAEAAERAQGAIPAPMPDAAEEPAAGGGAEASGSSVVDPFGGKKKKSLSNPFG